MTETATSSLQPDRLRRSCDPKNLGFDTTAEIEPLRESVGQDLAMRAVRFGLDVDHPGYNIFALGLPGSGRTTMIRQLLEDRARDEDPPPDWCYVNNFAEPREPDALRVPTGRGPELRDDVDRLLLDLQGSLPKALGSEEFQKERYEITEHARDIQRRLIEGFQEKIEGEPHVALVQTPMGFSVAPALEGQPIDEKRFQSLSEDQRERILKRRRDLEKTFSEIQRQARDADRDAQRELLELQRRVAENVVKHAVREIEARWTEVPEVIRHLERLSREIVENADQFSGAQEETGDQSALPVGVEDPLADFRVNVLVHNRRDRGAPVIQEPAPTYHNLVGRIEHRVQYGTMMTDFNQITAGALHRANGGYLILEAADLLRKPLAWLALKNTLRTRSIRLEEIIEYTSPIATQSLKPEPVKLNVRVILIGDPYTYYLLHAYDEDFRELFKVKADFSPYMDRNDDSERAYGAFIAARCEEESLPPFEAAAVARVTEFGSRMAEHQNRLSTRFGSIGDLVREASFFARSNGRNIVTAEEVTRAIREREDRVNRAERELLELIESDTLAVEPSGERCGQIFGLAVLAAAEHSFARPIKIEASAFMGTSGVVDIEREVRLGGPLHNKGVLVLSGYLGDQFAQSHPLIMSVSLSFDQLYEEVEGDSASAAELYALISAIADVPLRQGIAVTGAVNQKGDIQPIGAVTTKIEGFFRACQRRGLTGDQGVIIPARNMANLVLNDEVVEAVRAGRFSVWPIRQVEQGWHILTGLPAGIRGPDGGFPDDTVYGRAAARLWAWARGWREFGRPVRAGRQPEASQVPGGPSSERSDDSGGG